MAWVIIRANQRGSWRPYWEGLLAAAAKAVPPDWKVIVSADQGLYADWLFAAIQKQGWHPMLRVSLQMGLRIEGEKDLVAIGKRVERRGRGWKGQGVCSETGGRVQGTVLVRWEKGYEQAIAVVTDLAQEEVELAWYLMRFWIEDEYKDHKSGGWGWQQTKMEDPKRAERLWLAMAVAMQIAVLVGGVEEAKQEGQRSRTTRPAKPLRRVGRPAKPLHKPRGREQSCLVQGQQSIQAAVVRAEALPQGYVVSEPWPRRTSRPSKPTGKQGTKCQKREANRRYKQRRRARGDEANKQQIREHAQERRTQQRQAKRANVANREAEQQQERETRRRGRQQEQARERRQRELQRHQRQEEQTHKREVRLQRKEDDERERIQRRLWHEEVQRERAARLQRKEQRAARSSSLPTSSSSSSSRFLPSPLPFTPPPQPP